MDPEFGRVDKADALRNLFHGAGHLKAPADMEQRVLSALSEAPMKADVPLIPNGAWVTIGMMLGTAIGAGLMLADGSSGSGILPRSVPPQWLDVGPVMDLVTSKWGIAAVASALALVALDRMLLNRVRSFLLA